MLAVLRSGCGSGVIQCDCKNVVRLHAFFAGVGGSSSTSSWDLLTAMIVPAAAVVPWKANALIFAPLWFIEALDCLRKKKNASDAAIGRFFVAS